MTIIKVAHQDTTQAFETVYIIKGLFKKRVYRLDVTQLAEIPLKGLSHEKKA